MCVCDDDYVNGIDCSAWKEKTKWNNTSLRKMMVFSKLWQQVPPTLCNKSWKWIFVNLMIEFSVCWAIAVKWMYSLISQIDSDIGKFEASTFLRSTCTMCYTVHTHTYTYIYLIRMKNSILNFQHIKCLMTFVRARSFWFFSYSHYAFALVTLSHSYDLHQHQKHGEWAPCMWHYALHSLQQYDFVSKSN